MEGFFLPNITTYYKYDSRSEMDNTQVEQNRELINRPRKTRSLGRGDITNQQAKVELLSK